MNETLTHSETLKSYEPLAKQPVLEISRPGRRWATQFDHCVSCGTTHFRHTARGLCRHCYNIENPPSRGLKLRDSVRVLNGGRNRVNLEWQHRARYDYRRLGLTAEESLYHWPFDQKPTVFEWWQLVEVSE